MVSVASAGAALGAGGVAAPDDPHHV
jgi:hypothetical protein